MSAARGRNQVGKFIRKIGALHDNGLVATCDTPSEVLAVAVVVLTGSTKWSRVRQHAERIAAAVASATPGSYAEVEIPFGPK
jgi:hypothetical protein